MTAAHEDIVARPHVVYRAFTRRGRLLYVGCTSNLPQRLRDHRNALWWRSTIRWEIEGPYDYPTARRVESAAIKAERPAHNVDGIVPGYRLGGYRASEYLRRATASAVSA